MTPIVIILQTFQRTDYAIATIRAAKERLQYGGDLRWCVADDGSDPGHVKAIVREIGDALALVQSERIGYGALANALWEYADGISDLTLWLEDDWELLAPLDLTPYVQLLTEDATIGMVRFGCVPGNSDVREVTLNGIAYYEFLKSTSYFFSGNPSLRHRRFRESYGLYPTGEQPGETERIYDSHIRGVADGVRIVRPTSINPYGAFAHIGVRKSF